MSGDILLWTKVLVKNETGWAILLEFKPDVKRTLGTTIRFVRAEHKGKDVVTNSITTTEPSGFEEFFDTLEQIDKIHSVYISQICLEMKTEEATPSKIGDLINFNPNSWDNILERYFKDKTILGVDSSRIYYV